MNTLENIAKITGGKRMPKGSLLINEPNSHPYITVSNMNNNFEDLSTYQYVPIEIFPQIKNYVVDSGDLIISVAGTLGLVKKVPHFLDKANLTENANRISEIKIDTDYLQYYLNTSYIQNRILAVQTNNAQPKLALKEIRKFKIKYPPLDNQKKVSRFLSLIDKKIELLKKKHQEYQNFKKYLMQQIFSQKLRFKSDNNEKFEEWKERKLSEFLIEHKLKSTGHEEVYSVSVHKGVVNQVEHLGRAFSAPDTSKYNLVKPGDIVYTKSPTGDFPLGIIKQSRVNKNVIVSPLYGVFTPETYDLGYILNDYFESNVNTHNYLQPIVQKGAKNTMNITNKTFLSKSLLVPTDKEEQHKIAKCLMKVNENINLIELQKNQAEEFKKGLLQQMFV